MFLCHKCSGLLVHHKSDDVSGLLSCSCISGYYRGFEPSLTRAQAIDAQINCTTARLELYRRQGRSAQYIDLELAKLEQLEELRRREIESQQRVDA